MRRALCSLAIVCLSLTAIGAGPNPATGGVHAAPPAPTAPLRTFTGILEQRVFIQNCHCFPWVVDKNGRVFEMDITAVQADAQALNGSRVRATGTWSTYRRAGRPIAYLIVTQLDPA